MRCLRFVGLMFIGCVSGQRDDGFRAKLAAGCATVDACKALEEESSRRWSACIDAKQATTPCQTMNDDRERAHRLRKDREAADDTDRIAKQDAHLREVSAARGRYADAAKSLRGDCGDAAIVESAIGSLPPSVTAADRASYADSLHDRAAQERKHHAASVASALRQIMRQPIRLAEEERPESALDAVADARAQMHSIDCQGQEPTSGLAELSAEVDAWASLLQAAVERERACRADAECMANRAAQPLCEALESKRAHQEDLAHERANPAGVVNLRFLHETGQALQDDEARIKRARADYTTMTRKPFNEARCKKN